MELSRSVQTLLSSADAAGLITAGVAQIADADGVIAQGVVGLSEPAAQARFDLGSLTKPLIATLALQLDRAGVLPLGLSVGSLRPGGSEPAQLEDLLRHRAGMPAWTPLPVRAAEPAAVREILLQELARAQAPLGTYSDLDYILWGLLVSSRLGRSLAELLEAELARPWNLPSLGFGPVTDGSAVAIACGNEKEVELASLAGFDLPRHGAGPPGEVQDGNARFLSGIAAHAGAFASCDDMTRFARQWLRALRSASQHLPESAARQALTGLSAGTALGWRPAVGRSWPRGARGDSFGHLGFPGGSLAVFPRPERVAVLLAHRRESLSDLSSLRADFHRLAAGG